MKKKKKLLNFTAFLVFLIICTVPYLNWEKKNHIHSDFTDIKEPLFYISSNNPFLLDSLALIETKVNEFTFIHPIPDSLYLGEFLSSTNLRNTDELRLDFFDKVHAIENFYRKSEKKSNTWMFFFLLIGHGVLALMRHYIKKLVK